MEHFGTYDPVFQGHLTGKFYTLRKYHKSPGLLRRPKEEDRATVKGVEEATLASMTSPTALCLEEPTTLASLGNS